jgi:CoA:oxalate CoA-transferase
MASMTTPVTKGGVLPLAGVRILDIGRYVAGPFAARLLARLGAEVLKIEPPGRGDPVRRIGPFKPGAARGESGPLHLFINEGKRGLTLNLQSTTGRDLFCRLIALSDVVIENFEPRVLPGLGLSYEVLRRLNPRLVLTSVSNFGSNGPYQDYKASELTLSAIGGHAYQTGAAERTPLKMGGKPAQYLSAMTAAFATLVALRFAEETGNGQRVDYSIFESQILTHAQAMVEVSYYGEETGARSRRGVDPLRRMALVARDGPAMVSVQEQQMARAAQLVAAPVEIGRADPMQPGAGRAALLPYLRHWAAARTSKEVYEQAQRAHIPASYVASPADLLESPQYRHRRFFGVIEHPEAGSITVPGLPFHWDEPAAPLRPAPRLGEHNAEFYGSLLGLRPSELDTLTRMQVI